MTVEHGLLEWLATNEERHEEFCRTARLLVDHPDIAKCPAFQEVVDAEWYVSYFERQRNMALVRGASLGRGLLGLVAVREMEIGRKKRNLFLAEVAAIENDIQEHFAIAHELGHILLHGELMYPGMVLRERSWEYSVHEDQRRCLMELEANIYALLSVVPTAALEALEEAKGGELTMQEVQLAFTWLKGQPFPWRLAMERLALHRALRGELEVGEFTNAVLRWRFSWTLDGAGGSWRDASRSMPEKVNYEALDAETMRRWRAKLTIASDSRLGAGTEAGSHAERALTG